MQTLLKDLRTLMHQNYGQRTDSSTYPNTVGGGRGNGDQVSVEFTGMKAPNKMCCLWGCWKEHFLAPRWLKDEKGGQSGRTSWSTTSLHYNLYRTRLMTMEGRTFMTSVRGRIKMERARLETSGGMLLELRVQHAVWMQGLVKLRI